MSLLKRLYRTALDRELGVVGDELAAEKDRVDSLLERYERLQARIGMRTLRDERSAGKQPTRQPVSEAEYRALMNGPAPRRNPVSDWPEQEQ